MYKLLSVISFVALSLGAAVASPLKESDFGICPNTTVISEFDPPRYLGTWFENRAFYTIFERGQECIQATYGSLGPTTISITNTGRYANGDPVLIEGSGEILAPGVLAIQFPGTPVGDYRVLGTDYTSFSCVYTCSKSLGIRTQFAWILTREAVISKETEEKALEIFKQNGVDISLFHETYQKDDCEYV